MDKEQFFNDIEATFNRCLEIGKNKNADYAQTSDPFKNFRLCETIGVCSVETGILVRICDKISRIVNLLNKGEENAMVKDERLEDTIMDNINYLAILKSYLKQKQTK